MASTQNYPRPAADSGGRRAEGDERRAALRLAQRDAHVAEISARLRHVCQHLTDDEFARLVLEMAETKLRFAAIDAESVPRRRPAKPDDVR